MTLRDLLQPTKRFKFMGQWLARPVTFEEFNEKVKGLTVQIKTQKEQTK